MEIDVKKITVLFLIAITVSTSSSLVLRVPDEYGTIGDGISASADGDTVSVAAGTYSGKDNKRLSFAGKAINLISESGPEATVIDCENNGRAFIFNSNEDSLSRLVGFTITNGNIYEGGGIYCYNSSPYISKCVIIGNTTDVADGGGISCYASSPRIEDCMIKDNSAANGGGGISCYESSAPLIRNCEITGNYAGKNGGAIRCNSSDPAILNCIISGNEALWRGGGIRCNASNPVIYNCTVDGNTAGNAGGGIDCHYTSSPTISACTISNNTAIFGGGLECYDLVFPAIDSCIISSNSASKDGGGIDCSYYANPTMEDCVIVLNSAVEEGGGVFIARSDPVINKCVISGNSAETSGGVCISYLSSPTIRNCMITGNTATIRGGAIECRPQSKPQILHCTFSNNSALRAGGIFTEDTQCVIANCILWNDLPQEIFVLSGSLNIMYSHIEGGWPGDENYDEDPLFVGEGNYHLSPDSPCIDTGMDAGTHIDIDGDSRPLGAGYDRGSDEFRSTYLQMWMVR